MDSPAYVFLGIAVVLALAAGWWWLLRGRGRNAAGPPVRAAEFATADPRGGTTGSCTNCGKEVDAEEREPMLDGVREQLQGSRPLPAMMENAMFSVVAATRAWRCERCGDWQCNDCVVGALNRRGGQVPAHHGCGGRFLPPG